MKQMLKSGMRTRLAILVCFVLVLQGMATILPTRSLFAEEVKAENYYYAYTVGGLNDYALIQIEAGQSVSLGDYIRVYGWDIDQQKEILASMMSAVKATYTSSDSSVASVDNKGNLKALSVGNATITVTYKTIEPITLNMEVVEKDSFYPNGISGLDEMKAALKKLKAAVPSNGKMTEKNAYNLMKLQKNVQMYTPSSVMTDSGVEYDYDTEVCKIVFPEAAVMNVVDNMKNNFASTYHPFSTASSKSLKVKSASAKAGSNVITINFKSKVTEAHILAMQTYSDEPLNKKKAVYPYIYICDDEGNYYYGEITVNVKKSSAKIKLTTYDWETDAYIPVKLSKSRTYYIGNDKILDWGNKTKIKLK